MIFHENRLLADDSHEISYLNFVDVAKSVDCCVRDWRFKSYLCFLLIYENLAITCTLERPWKGVPVSHIPLIILKNIPYP